jgi:hypothetical protein
MESIQLGQTSTISIAAGFAGIDTKKGARTQFGVRHLSKET